MGWEDFREGLLIIALLFALVNAICVLPIATIAIILSWLF